MIRVVRTENGLSFPEFEEGSRLDELVHSIASALGTSARKPTGSAVEILVGFEGYPDEFALWWDGVTCELGCSSPTQVSMEAIGQRLLASGRFLQP